MGKVYISCDRYDWFQTPSDRIVSNTLLTT